ncbi:cytochrome P450 [Pseudarthrobacter albicanus]|uniref:cytochrome P450 n=1 Tax=Pseudarthrobacter albicanus TaxID=2823873 RepID=UPI001BA4B3C8
MTRVPAIEQPLNPFRHYEAMRRSQPVFHDQESGVWHVYRYDDVQRVLSEHSTFSSRMAGDNPSGTGQLFAASLINTDPPRHRQLRSLVTQAFTPRAVEALAPRIAEITDALLAPAAPLGTMDLIEELAYPLPVIVIAELMGIPAADRDRFKKWSDVIVSQARPAPDESGPGAPDGHGTAHHEMAEYFIGMIEERRRRPGNDLISRLLAAQIDGQHLNAVELLGFCALLLVAGNETTTNLIGNAVLSFTERPGTIERLRAGPALMPDAIEEVLRYRSPVQSMYRVAAADTTLGDRRIPAGSPLVAWIGSANRDPAHFPSPDAFDIQRSPNRHLAFGQGIHFCLGAPLARLEARIALQAVISRLPGLALAPGTQLERMESTIIYGLKQIPVTWQAA